MEYSPQLKALLKFIGDNEKVVDLQYYRTHQLCQIFQQPDAHIYKQLYNKNKYFITGEDDNTSAWKLYVESLQNNSSLNEHISVPTSDKCYIITILILLIYFLVNLFLLIRTRIFIIRCEIRCNQLKRSKFKYVSPDKHKENSLVLFMKNDGSFTGKNKTKILDILKTSDEKWIHLLNELKQNTESILNSFSIGSHEIMVNYREYFNKFNYEPNMSIFKECDNPNNGNTRNKYREVLISYCKKVCESLKNSCVESEIYDSWRLGNKMEEAEKWLEHKFVYFFRHMLETWDVKKEIDPVMFRIDVTLLNKMIMDIEERYNIGCGEFGKLVKVIKRGLTKLHRQSSK